MSAPALKVTDPTPGVERQEFINDQDEVITNEPKRSEDMSLNNNSENSGDDNRSSMTVSDMGSGFERDTNECTEFWLECCGCFGLLESCFPNDGEGCCTSTATFIGTICLSCWKC